MFGRLRSVAGFTLVELMITLAVIAIGAAIAFPSFRGVLQSNRVSTATNELIASMSLARSEAIRSSQPAGVCPSETGTKCEGHWADGVLVWVQSRSGAKETVRYTMLNQQLVIEGAADGIEFDSRGRRKGSPESLYLEPVDCVGGGYRREIQIGVTGQVRADKKECEE